MKELSINSINIESPVQRAALIIIIGITLNVAVIYFCIWPLQSRITGIRNSIEESIQRNDRYKSVIRTTSTTKQKVAALLKEHEKITASGVLTPLLNSYAMRAKTLIKPVAAKSSLKIENVDELPPIPLQQQQPMKDEIFYRQPIMFTASGSYTQLTTFVSYIENELPMAALSSLKIISQARSPERHKISICFEWPVKTKINMKNDSK